MSISIWPDNHLTREYLRLKTEIPSALLFLQMGCFLEAWGADAVCAAPILGVRLTRRSSFVDGLPIPMCGIPADSRFAGPGDSDLQFIGSTAPYLRALTDAGYAVATANCLSTSSPMTRRIEFTFWPDEDWARKASRSGMN